MYKHFFKRLFDFCIALMALLLIGWFLIIITIWLHFANRGAGAASPPPPSPKGEGTALGGNKGWLRRFLDPVIFTQERPGKDEKIFKLIKFKSMTDERDENGVLLPDGLRLTRAGRFVRSTSIDELPQLINVLKGDMAFVGPRPLLPEYLPYYTEKERLRHTVRPGMTGWAQVHGRNNLKWDDRLAMDVFYVSHLSLLMDIRILFKTVMNVLSRKDVVVLPDALGEKLDIERARKSI